MQLLLLTLKQLIFRTYGLMIWVPGIPPGPKKPFFRFCPSGTLRISTQCPRGALSNYYVVTRRYYVHKSYKKYHRQIADARGESDYKTFLIQGGYTQEQMKTM